MNGKIISKDIKGEIMEDIRIEVERLLLKALKEDNRIEVDRLMKIRVDIAYIKSLM